MAVPVNSKIRHFPPPTPERFVALDKAAEGIIAKKSKRIALVSEEMK